MAAVGTLAITTQSIAGDVRRQVTKITLAWTCTAGGAVSGILTNYISGELARVVFAPGSPAPTNGYTAVLLDTAGIDMLANQGASLSSTVTTNVKPGVSFVDGTTTSTGPINVDDTLELQISGAGASKKGTVYLYVR